MKYIAEDGMIFSTEDACRTHESRVSRAKLEEISKYCTLYDYDEDLDYVSLTAQHKPYIIHVHSNFEKVATYIDKYTTWSAEGIESNDIYVWGENEWCWETLDSVINKHEKIIEDIKTIKNEISKGYI